MESGCASRDQAPACCQRHTLERTLSRETEVCVYMCRLCLCPRGGREQVLLAAAALLELQLQDRTPGDNCTWAYGRAVVRMVFPFALTVL